MPSVVEAIKPHPKNEQWRIVTVGGKDFIAFSAALADGLEKGKPLPEGTTEEPPKFDGALPSIRFPRPKGSAPQTAYRNTKEGQAYEQERMDRRTALMQAVTRAGLGAGTGQAPPVGWGGILDAAEEMYAWLRETSAVGEPGPGIPAQASGGPTSAPPLRDGADKPEGQPKPSDYGEGSSDKATPPATNLWDEARELGLTPPKAVVMARRIGWDGVLSSTDLSDEQLRELIETRRKELV